MADTKISAMTDGSPLQSTDEFVIARSSANYSIPGSVVRPPGSSELVYRYTVSGSNKASIDTGSDSADAGSNDWTNGDLLEIYLYARTDETAVASTLNLTFNNDTGSHYDLQSVAGVSTSASAAAALAASAFQSSVLGASAAANYFSTFKLVFPNYAGTTGYKQGEWVIAKNESTASNNRVSLLAAAYRSTSAITRFAVAPNTSGKNLVVGTQLLIYKRIAAT